VRRAVDWGLTTARIDAAFEADGGDGSVVAARRVLARLLDTGLLRASRQPVGAARIYTATVPGARAAGLADRRVAIVGWSRQPHAITVALVAAHRFAEAPQRLVTERMMRRDEALADGSAVWSVRVRGEAAFLHRPDFAVLAEPAAPIAVEVERSAKSAKRLFGILSAYRRAVGDGRYSSVLYVCGTVPIETLVRRVAHEAALAAIEVVALDRRDGAW
jgi:hypothetical protein